MNFLERFFNTMVIRHNHTTSIIIQICACSYRPKLTVHISYASGSHCKRRMGRMHQSLINCYLMTNFRYTIMNKQVNDGKSILGTNQKWMKEM